MIEILAPAGNKECAIAAVTSGADAIYLGYAAFSARANAGNFDFDGLKEIITYAHLFGVEVYVTLNTMVKTAELDEFLSTLLAVHNLGADGILLQDMLLGKEIHARYPEITLHLSTQAGVNNRTGALLAKEYGFSRVVLARETALADVRLIAKEVETEVFVQGALCTCFSGQCYLSSFIGGNSGNRGRCKQPCRKKYTYQTREKKECYALSLADLSVGEGVKELSDAGVVSFKIEGRMRRPEYVAAAVTYYKKLFAGEDTQVALSDLKRTYNRGNYTKGLAFGQDKRFLSTAVQGHIGEKVGVIKVINGKYFVETREKFAVGDGFKILRGGEETGGGVFVKQEPRGFYLSSRDRLKNGDGVFITTDTAVNARLLSKTRKIAVNVAVTEEDGRLKAVGEGVEKISDFTLQAAKSAPMSEADIKNCFLKTDDYPFEITFSRVNIEGNYFVPKSALNAFRRDFYAAVYETLTKNTNTQYTYQPFETLKIQRENGGKLAVMGENFRGISADIYVVKPKNYADSAAYAVETGKDGEKFLYLPAFMSEEDLKGVEAHIAPFDGVYAEGYYGIACAKKWGKKLFAGTGFNLANPVAATQAAAFDYFALSKELDFAEQKELAAQNAFVLSAGKLKVMDFIYCPFGKKCATCENKDEYTLTDADGREFVLRRYKTAGGCRFELFNPA
ncbi:MAG: U32 family peptidase, partial [Clostridia bacterium]|nr:U32 family peptidase [Clostridia bacterium]